VAEAGGFLGVFQMKPYYDVILSPIITERARLKAGPTLNQYSFKVAMSANKIEIARAVEEAFDIKNKVLAVNTHIVPGKYKRRGRKGGYRPDWKKAIITLVKGVTIEDVFPSIE
jgi:large subunit ribosomal protein L23